MPHVCGDEPCVCQDRQDTHGVCPTYVGMNRDNLDHLRDAVLYAPRMWG